MVVIVLGMHRSGTSAVANVLHHLGVSMGDNLFPANRWNPRGYYEDVDFFDVSVELIHAAGGHWGAPPEAGLIQEVGAWFLPQMVGIVGWKERTRGTWGWKDPRTLITLPVWWEALNRAGIQDVRMVRVKREHEAVVQSLVKRAREAAALAAETGEEDAGLADMATWEHDRWDALIHEYERRGAQFLSEHAEVPCITVSFEDLVRAETTRVVVELLADYVHRGAMHRQGTVEAAVRQIEVRG